MKPSETLKAQIQQCRSCVETAETVVEAETWAECADALVPLVAAVAQLEQEQREKDWNHHWCQCGHARDVHESGGCDVDLCICSAFALPLRVELQERTEKAEAQIAQQAQKLKTVENLLAAKYLNPVCALDGCQFLQPRTEEIELRETAQALSAQVEQLKKAAPMFACHYCGKDFAGPVQFSLSIGGIPAQTFFFCSADCREMNSGGAAVNRSP